MSISHDPLTLRRIAVATDLDPRTVARALEGDRPVLSATKVRVERALRELGLDQNSQATSIDRG